MRPLPQQARAREESLRQILRLPDERLRRPAHGGRSCDRRLCRNGNARGGGSRHPQHLPHPREGRREGLFRARTRPRAEGRARRPGARDAGRRGGLRRPGGGRGDPSPRPLRGRRGRAAELSPPAGAAVESDGPGVSSTPNSRSRTSSTICRLRRRRRSEAAASRPSSRSRRAATSSAPSAWCPIPGAPRCRARSPGSSRRRDASRRPASASSPSSART